MNVCNGMSWNFQHGKSYMHATATISLATTTQELAECLELRRVVFIQEQNVAEHEERDGEDNICTHVIARLDGDTVGAARFQQIADAIKIQRVCVAKFHRGQHIANARQPF